MTGARIISLGRRAKYGLIDKPDFFEWLEKNWRDVFEQGGAARIQAIATSCQAKADVVVIEPFAATADLVRAKGVTVVASAAEVPASDEAWLTPTLGFSPVRVPLRALRLG